MVTYEELQRDRALLNSQRYLRSQSGNNLQALQQRRRIKQQYDQVLSQAEVQAREVEETPIVESQPVVQVSVPVERDYEQEIIDKIRIYQKRLNAKDSEVVQKAKARIKLLNEVRDLPTETQAYLIDSGELSKLESKAISSAKLDKFLNDKNKSERLAFEKQYIQAGLTAREAQAAAELSQVTQQSVTLEAAREYSKKGVTPADLGTIYVPVRTDLMSRLPTQQKNPTVYPAGSVDELGRPLTQPYRLTAKDVVIYSVEFGTGINIPSPKGLKVKLYEPQTIGIRNAQGRVVEFSPQGSKVFVGSGEMNYEQLLKNPKLRQVIKKAPALETKYLKEDFIFGGKVIATKLETTKSGDEFFTTLSDLKGKTSSGIKFKGMQLFRGRNLKEVPVEFIPLESQSLFATRPITNPLKIKETLSPFGEPIVTRYYQTPGFTGKGISVIKARKGNIRTQRTLDLEGFGGEGADLVGTPINVGVSRARPLSKAVRTRFKETQATNVRGLGIEVPKATEIDEFLVQPNKAALKRIQKRGTLTYGDSIASGLASQLAKQYKQPPISKLSSKLSFGVPRSTTQPIPKSIITFEDEIQPLSIKSNQQEMARTLGIPQTQFKTNQLSLSSQRQDSFTKNLYKSINLNKVITAQKVDAAQRTSQIPKQQFKSILKTQQLSKQLQIPKQITIPRTSQIPRTQVPRSSIPRLPKLPSSSQSINSLLKLQTPKANKAYQLMIKRYGKYNPAGLLPRGKALARGEQLTRQSLAASFKIVPTNKLVDELDIPYKVSDIFRTYKVKKGRRVPLVDEFIQRRGTRLGSRSEVREIQRSRKKLSIW